ncbi:hypothetical protein OUZ56_024039 [Daphnia magna]|uniref:Uncharacterized protein n=1 Tax=Daphnia magna TaxID=35525 RepID=A0ABR0B007_9CRUS|nr:hypothetical protein OUZ56_024039 [Daphnia magna]
MKRYRPICLLKKLARMTVPTLSQQDGFQRVLHILKRKFEVMDCQIINVDTNTLVNEVMDIQSQDLSTSSNENEFISITDIETNDSQVNQVMDITSVDSCTALNELLKDNQITHQVQRI